MSSNSRKQYRKRIVFLFFVLVMFIVILISTIFNDAVQIYNNKKQTEELTAYYNELLEEETSLNSEVVKLQDPEYIARYAREKYLYTKDGEKILTIVEPER
jgi:cell division protein DivIC